MYNFFLLPDCVCWFRVLASMVRGYVPELVGDGVGWPAKVLERHRAEEQEPMRHRPLHVQAWRNSAQQVRNASTVLRSIAT